MRLNNGPQLEVELRHPRSLHKRIYHQWNLRDSMGSSSTIPGHTASETDKIPLHEPCFITKRIGYDLKKFYWIKPDKDNVPEQKRVGQYLISLGLVPLDFDLHSATNTIKLDRNLHHILEKLGLFAVTCAKSTLEAILTLLKEENKRFDERQGRYQRFFQLDKEPFSNAQYELVLVYPNHFLPNGSALTMHFPHPENEDELVAKLYMIGNDGVLREGRDSNSPRFPAFYAPDSDREQQHRVNPFLAIIYAEIVFRRYLRSSPTKALPAEYQELVDLTTAVVKEIYHPPLVEKVLPYADMAAKCAATENDGQPETKPKDDVALAKKTTSRQVDASGKYIASTYSSYGPEVKKPGKGASHEEYVEYFTYLMSGRDKPLTRQDKANLKATGLYVIESDEDEED
ncbi:hypothetical protein CVT26_013040 [Gymnopilus dilepis]|uniref:Uncharacterized protein n=1 Tax=Gymnopilus dilepis TaxID=231916 RepID=A0A409Y4J6_9AGAR|nr:hypothetical protein CVT26_013040 [Gymnopilus dilepis]